MIPALCQNVYAPKCKGESCRSYYHVLKVNGNHFFFQDLSHICEPFDTTKKEFSIPQLFVLLYHSSFPPQLHPLHLKLWTPALLLSPGLYLILHRPYRTSAHTLKHFFFFFFLNCTLFIQILISLSSNVLFLFQDPLHLIIPLYSSSLWYLLIHFPCF